MHASSTRRLGIVIIYIITKKNDRDIHFILRRVHHASEWLDNNVYNFYTRGSNVASRKTLSKSLSHTVSVSHDVYIHDSVYSGHRKGCKQSDALRLQTHNTFFRQPPLRNVA